MIRTSTLPTTAFARGLLAGAALTTTLVLSACGGSATTTSSGSGMGPGSMMSTSAPASTTSFNDADVAFAQAMIPHHRQALQMAALAKGRTADARVKALAGRIEAAQQPEINTMNAWLVAWGKPTPVAGTTSGMAGMGQGAMPGMMSNADLGRLMAAKGTPFDKMFLTMMISHHEGAITMAKQENAQGSNADAKALAQKIITDQQAEITTMKGILAQA